LPRLWGNLSNVKIGTYVAKLGSLCALRSYFGGGWNIFIYLMEVKFGHVKFLRWLFDLRPVWHRVTHSFLSRFRSPTGGHLQNLVSPR